jgi:hypothetical protein|tara:strand:+ start:1166 stop:2005 length:840 start_codon:yes stop_codon:yes gene_type:complete
MIEKGFLIYANNTWKTDYLKQAYALGLSIKLFNPNAHITVVTNTEVSDRYKKVLDDVIFNKIQPRSILNAEDRINAFDISPYLKTIVLDADTLVTENLDGWWKYLKNYMIFYSSAIRTYRGVIDRSVVYRKVFVRNQLPNLYNTIHYFEKSEEAALFYRMQRLVIENWKLFYDKYTPTKKQKWCSMDVSSAITSKLLCNEDEITAKDSFINVVHLKPKHQGWKFDYVKSSTAVTLNFSKNNFYIGNYKQNGIIHYVEKGFLTDYLIKQLEEANETVLAV